jgi:hypothetical protein
MLVLINSPEFRGIAEEDEVVRLRYVVISY